MRHRRDDGPFIGLNWVDLYHEGVRDSTRKVLSCRIFQDRRGKRAELLAELDLGIDDLAHVCAARVGQDAAVAKRPRAPLHRSLEPPDDEPLGNPRGRPFATRLFVVDPTNLTTLSFQILIP